MTLTRNLPLSTEQGRTRAVHSKESNSFSPESTALGSKHPPLPTDFTKAFYHIEKLRLWAVRALLRELLSAPSRCGSQGAAFIVMTGALSSEFEDIKESSKHQPSRLRHCSSSWQYGRRQAQPRLQSDVPLSSGEMEASSKKQVHWSDVVHTMCLRIMYIVRLHREWNYTRLMQC